MLLTVQEATGRLGITRAALYAAMADGRLKYVEKYGKRLIDERALKSYQPRAYRGQRVRGNDLKFTRKPSETDGHVDSILG